MHLKRKPRNFRDHLEINLLKQLMELCDRLSLSLRMFYGIKICEIRDKSNGVLSALSHLVMSSFAQSQF